MVQYSALRCVSGIWQNNEKLLISNGLRSVVTYLLTVALWVLFHCARHSFANIARQKQANVYDISKALGHSSLKITEGYLAKFDTASQDATMRRVFQHDTQADDSNLLAQLQSLSPERLASLLAQVNR